MAEIAVLTNELAEARAQVSLLCEMEMTGEGASMLNEQVLTERDAFAADLDELRESHREMADELAREKRANDRLTDIATKAEAGRDRVSVALRDLQQAVKEHGWTCSDFGDGGAHFNAAGSFNDENCPLCMDTKEPT